MLPSWHKTTQIVKTGNMSKLKVSFVTDIHNGPTVGNKYGEKALRLTEKFVEATNKFGADLAVDMGDRITDQNPETDRQNMTSLRELFNDLACPFHCVDGNHDTRNLSHDDNAEIMEQPKGSFSTDNEGFHVVFWKPEITTYDQKGLYLHEGDLDWLRQDLASTDLPTIIVTHVPLDDKMGGHDSPDNPTRRFAYPNANEARQIIEDAGNVVLCMGGHRHTNSHQEINGVHYITLQSLVQGQKGEGKRSPHGTFAFAEFDSEEGSIKIDLQGKYHKTYNLNFTPKGP